MSSLPEPNDNGTCTNCGESNFTLARDVTEYTLCEWNGKEFDRTYSHLQESQADDAVRFFCASCGTQHAVPKGLP